MVITASHNPPHDNGFKAYFEDGAQVVTPHDKGIIDEVNAVPLGELELADLQPARRGEVSIEVTFKVDTNGILRVRARDGVTGAVREAAVNVRGAMSDSEVEEAAERQRYEEASNLPEVPQE